jgi:formate dehydrogenase formation protein
VTHPGPPRAPRSETREIVELKRLKTEQPELGSAVDMQLALVEMQRRVQSRVPLPWISADATWLQEQQRAGRALVRFADIPLDWTDFRLTFRQTADILRRFDALDAADHKAIVDLAREGNTLEPIVVQWYEATSGGDAARPSEAPANIDQVLVLALKPFLSRCAEVLTQRTTVSSNANCPFCGWEPEFAVFTQGGDRQLICGRCAGQWPFSPTACPFCGNDDRGRLTSFSTRDGRYRVSACDACKRYLKAYDARYASRPVMVAVDSIATLPLDAIAMQRGYV